MHVLIFVWKPIGIIASSFFWSMPPLSRAWIMLDIISGASGIAPPFFAGSSFTLFSRSAPARSTSVKDVRVYSRELASSCISVRMRAACERDEPEWAADALLKLVEREVRWAITCCRKGIRSAACSSTTADSPSGMCDSKSICTGMLPVRLDLSRSKHSPR